MVLASQVFAAQKYLGFIQNNNTSQLTTEEIRDIIRNVRSEGDSGDIAVYVTSDVKTALREVGTDSGDSVCNQTVITGSLEGCDEFYIDGDECETDFDISKRLVVLGTSDDDSPDEDTNWQVLLYIPDQTEVSSEVLDLISRYF